jgi:pSer/pThr/pTyr-binding forkhead associated (FHA) protein
MADERTLAIRRAEERSDHQHRAPGVAQSRGGGEATLSHHHRWPSADIRVLDDGISREHVELRLEGERVRIRDLGSTNGTYCNGQLVHDARSKASAA